MLQPQDFTVGGHKIQVTPFPARRAFKYKVQLVKLFGAPIGKLLSGISTKGEHVDFDLSSGSLAIEMLLSNINEDSFYNFALQMMEFSRLDGKECNDQNFDLLFQGELSLVYQIIYFVIQVNYPDFFGKASTIIKKLQNLKTKKSEEESK
jgi:hypothetical protein